MTEFEKIVVKGFIAENWKLFLSFCAERCLSEGDVEEFAEEIFKALEES